MSLAFKGGSKQFKNVLIYNEMDVIAALQIFIQDKFRDGSTIAKEIARNDKHIIKFDEVKYCPQLHTSEEGTFIARGAFVYGAREHSVQTIWQNKFSVWRNEEGIFIRVSSWRGPTVDSWHESVKKNEVL